MSGAVSTSNMAEALYLFERGNRVVKIGMMSGWPYGIEELVVYFEGATAEKDHERYIKGNISVDLSLLPDLFGVLMVVIPQTGGEQ
jgi:hypothetical protein